MLTGRQFGRYEIQAKIGEGGMGEVYSALDAELDRKVAIKFLPSEFTADKERKSRFRQEARAASALNHPNIITIYEIGENENGSFLSTEFIDGQTLRELIKSESMTLARILKIIEQAANALVAAHSAHIVHRDIKPENIMVRRDSIVKVVDFGLAKPTQQKLNGNSETSETIPGMVMGSARYMSPEQARGLPVDERTDIWSLGVVLYELLTGSAPFKGETSSDTIAAVIYKEPEPIGKLLPGAPQELQRIIRKALQKDRDERYQSVKDFALDVKDVLYELEHENSGSRPHHTSTSPDIHENPTMIHRTISANHPTHGSGYLTSSITNASEKKAKKRVSRRLLAGLAAATVLFIVSMGLFGWLNTGGQLAATAFDKPQISRIKTDGRVLGPTISPDGKYLAYVSGEAGNRSLVVRQVSTESMIPVVPPTNLNLQFLTFSPDGVYVYYCQTRSDFSVNTLYQVPALGGTPKKLIEDVDGAVTFSPDGKEFAFQRHSTNPNEDIILTADVATLVAKPLIKTSQTDYDFFSNRLAWSPDGTKILIGAGKRQNGFVNGTALTEISIADKTITPINEKEFFTAGNFVWFADGSGFLFTGRETQESPVQIWRASYADGGLRQITNDFNDYGELQISSDGKTIVTMKGETSSSLWRFWPKSKEIRPVTNESRNVEGLYGLAEFPDKRILFTRTEGKDSEIWIADADGKNDRAITAGDNFVRSPVLTKDGRYIVFNLQKDKASRIWRMDSGGGNLVRLTEDNANFMDRNPQVTPDGKTVIFERIVANNEHGALMKVSIDGGPAELFHSIDNKSIFQPRISPDGKHIAFSTFDLTTFDKKIQVAAIEDNKFGRYEAELDYNLINQFFWSPDSKSLTVSTNRGGVLNLWRQPVDGSEPTPITEFTSGRILNFAWSADGKEILIARGNTNNDLLLVRDADYSASRETASRRSKISVNSRLSSLGRLLTSPLARLSSVLSSVR